MKRNRRQVLGIVLIAAGVLSLALVAGVRIQSALLERSSRAAEGTSTGTWTRPPAVSSRDVPSPGSRIGHLEIRRLGLTAALVEGIDTRSLLRGVGHVPGTAFPGEPENSALAGHRDTHFAALRRIEPGDSIRIDTADGIFVYEVDSAFVVAPDRGDLMRPTGAPTLTLITCYPFRWIGSAPERFIVRAHGVAPARSAQDTAPSTDDARAARLDIR
jgi:sortase A